MTYVKKCNRCGKEVLEQADDNELHFTKQRNTKSGYDECMHLCDDCLKDFNDFMIKKKETKKEKEEKDFSFIPRVNDNEGRTKDVKDKGISW